jgi:hypothetical protein
MQRIDQRRPQEFQRVGRADQREQADSAEIDAGLAHPHQQRRARQRQRQAGGKAEQQHDQHARLQVDRKALAPGGGVSVGMRWLGVASEAISVRSCKGVSRFGHKRLSSPGLTGRPSIPEAYPTHSQAPSISR